MNAKLILTTVAALALAGCDSPPDKMEIGTHANAVRASAREAEMARDKADEPGATPASGVDYRASLDRLAATIQAGKDAGVREDVLEQSRKLGEAEGKKIMTNLAEHRRQWEARWR